MTSPSSSGSRRWPRPWWTACAIRTPARAMAECGRRLVLERYDWDVLAEKLGRIWEGCLHEAR